MTWKALSPRYHQEDSSHCRKSSGTRGKIAKTPKSSRCTYPGCCGKVPTLIATREKALLRGWSLERTSPRLRETCPALTPELLCHEPVYLSHVLATFCFDTFPESLLLSNISLSPLDGHISLNNLFLIIPFLISIKNVHLGAELVGICFLSSSFTHLIQHWVICSSVSVVIFRNVPLLNVFPQ